MTPGVQIQMAIMFINKILRKFAIFFCDLNDRIRSQRYFWDESCAVIVITLQWRHNELDGVSNDQRFDCLHSRLFRRRSKKTSKLRVTGLREGNSPVTREFPAQRASNAENVSIWWRHHERNVKNKGYVLRSPLWDGSKNTESTYYYATGCLNSYGRHTVQRQYKIVYQPLWHHIYDNFTSL